MPELDDSWKHDDEPVMIYTCEECGNRTLTIPSVCPKCKKIVNNKAGTNFSTKIEILAEIWTDRREDEAFKDFCTFNDLGLPIAYLVNAELVTTHELGNQYIEETFKALLTELGFDEDMGFESLDDMLDES
jgi:hypothetical protein